MSIPNKLVILPCHSVYISQEYEIPKENDYPLPTTSGPGTSKDDWILASFQVESEDHLSFLRHLYKCDELLNKYNDSVCIISGGYTKGEVKDSESNSYYKVGIQRGLFKGTNKDKVFLEEFAKDSYENILFSLCLFYKKFNKLPQHIIIVGFEFKRERFLSLHCKTMKIIDNTNIDYIGIGPIYPLKNDESISEIDYNFKKNAFFDDLIKSEKKFALDLFKLNQFGSKGSKLNDKKQSRDPWNLKNKILDFYKTDNQFLNTLLEIDNYEYSEAVKLYNKFIK